MRRRTTPQPREKRKPAVEHDLPWADLEGAILRMVRVKSGGRYVYQLLTTSRGKATTLVYSSKRYATALSSFNRRVRKHAIRLALKALDL